MREQASAKHKQASMMLEQTRPNDPEDTKIPAWEKQREAEQFHLEAALREAEYLQHLQGALTYASDQEEAHFLLAQYHQQQHRECASSLLMTPPRLKGRQQPARYPPVRSFTSPLGYTPPVVDQGEVPSGKVPWVSPFQGCEVTRTLDLPLQPLHSPSICTTVSSSFYYSSYSHFNHHLLKQLIKLVSYKLINLHLQPVKLYISHLYIALTAH